MEGHIEIVLDFPALVGIGIAAYVSTNIDDLFILMVFFATPRFTSSQIVLGQYLGMGSLMVVSLAGSLVTLLLPHSIIGLIGLFPIAIGIKELLELRKKENEDDKMTSKKLQRKKMQMPFLTVATVTFSGGEEIGIYTALFATNNDVVAIITLVSAVMVLTMLWCLLANYLVKRSSLADRFRRIGDRILSFVLIGLGIYILAETFVIV
ncbi:MAG: cadmium resistance transporter [Thermoproteota archaeon]|nr:cadmium resistance transporter [Thermoproteota archaeon]